jgi:hypothetical protein
MRPIQGSKDNIICKNDRIFKASRLIIAVSIGIINTLSWAYMMMPRRGNVEGRTAVASYVQDDETYKVFGADSNYIARQLYSSQFKNYNCINARWRHETPMYNGTYMCDGDSFIFGMSKGGSLYWKDLSSGKRRFYFRNKNKTNGNYFILTIDAKFQVRNSCDVVLWEKSLEGYSHKGIGYHDCLKEWPCPYLHLHPDGVVVLNFINPSNDEWEEVDINKGYNFFHWK